MTDPVVEALTRRLDRVERGLRRWRVLGVIAWSALAAAVALTLLIELRAPGAPDAADEDQGESAPVVEDEVRARAFVLVDEDGLPRAALAMRPDGTPALAFSTPDGQLLWKAP